MFTSFADFLYNGFLGKFLSQESLNFSIAVISILFVLGFIVCMIIPYLLGSFNFAIIVSKKLYNDDIRNHGSGNGGMTNMLRTYGKGAAGLTLLGDFLKGIVSVVIGYLVLGYQTAFIAALFAMLGHMFPCYYKFKGGKGVLVSAACILLLDPLTFAVTMLIFVIIVAGTKFVSLGSIMAAFFYPLILNRLAELRGNIAILSPIPTITSILVAALIVFMHRANIKRLLDGKESKLSFKKKIKPNDTTESKEDDK